MSKRKLQVFVSSTYEDLRVERQRGVEAILSAGHIPAGMELFAAGEEQLVTIRKWIDESDALMLLLGGRYGSIDEKSGKSYTELEYRYAIEKGKPVFAVVAEKSYLHGKLSSDANLKIFEKDSPAAYEAFEKFVMERIVRTFRDLGEIEGAVKQALDSISQRSDVVGWVRPGGDDPQLPCQADFNVKNVQAHQEIGCGGDRSSLFFLLLNVVDCETARSSIRRTTNIHKVKEKCCADGLESFELVAMYDLLGKWDLIVKFRATGSSGGIDTLIDEVRNGLIENGQISTTERQESVHHSDFDKSGDFEGFEVIDVVQQSRSFRGILAPDVEETISYLRLKTTEEYERYRAQRSFLFLRLPPDKGERQALIRELDGAMAKNPRSAGIVESVCVAKNEAILELFSSCSQSMFINELNRAIEKHLTLYRLQKYTLSCYSFDEQAHEWMAMP